MLGAFSRITHSKWRTYIPWAPTTKDPMEWRFSSIVLNPCAIRSLLRLFMYAKLSSQVQWNQWESLHSSFDSSNGIRAFELMHNSPKVRNILQSWGSSNAFTLNWNSAGNGIRPFLFSIQTHSVRRSCDQTILVEGWGMRVAWEEGPLKGLSP